MASQKETAMTEKALLFALKNKKDEEVLNLLDRGTSVDLQDKATGKHGLHFAASNGSTKVVTRLLELGADVNCKDNNGDTPLHLATRGQHETPIALLVAFGANVDETNKAGHSALYVAVENKFPRIVDMLLKFGRAPCLSEWEWQVDKALNKKENQIIESLTRQITFLPGFKSGVIKSEVFYVRPQQPCTSESLQIELKTETISAPFVLQCYKMQYEYAKVKRQLKKEDPLTDLYELRTWDCREQELTLLVTVNERVRTDRKLKFIPVDKITGTVHQTTKKVDNSKTALTVDIKIKDKEYTKFTIATIEREEKIKISTSDSPVVLKPEVYPGTEIAIPQNSFEGDLDVSLKVFDTEETNIEEEKLLLATDALTINTSDGIQPKNEVDMTIPVHSNIKSQDVVVLASKDDHPDSVDDWEIVEPDLSNTGSVSFKASHFSMFVGVAKAVAVTEKGLAEIHEALEKTIARKKKVVFLVLTKEVPEEDGNLSVVVQCVLFRKQWAQKEEWKRKGYKLVSSSDSIVCTINSLFQISLSGNIEEVFHTKKIDLEFHMSRENYRVFNVSEKDCVVNKEEKATGEIDIALQETKIEIVPIAEPTPTCIFCNASTPATKEVEDTQFLKLCNLKFEHIVDKAMKLSKVMVGFRLLMSKAKKRKNRYVQEDNTASNEDEN